jgi:competence CoiA-like predicted nuclease
VGKETLKFGSIFGSLPDLLSRVKILIEYFVSKIYKNQFKKKTLDFRNSINI